jgi:hypothetical protein
MPTLQEQLASLPLLTSFNTHGGETLVPAPPFANVGWGVTDRGWEEAGYGYYGHNPGDIVAARWANATHPKNAAVSLELNHPCNSLSGEPYFEIWMRMSTASKTGLRFVLFPVATYEEVASEEVAYILHTARMELWSSGSILYTSPEWAPELKVVNGGEAAGGKVALVLLESKAEIKFMIEYEEGSGWEEWAAPITAGLAEAILSATYAPEYYCGVGSHNSESENYTPSMYNLKMGEVGESPASKSLAIPSRAGRGLVLR